MIEFDVQTRRKVVETADSGRQFRILLLGDFGGSTGKPLVIDRDNFEQILEKVRPAVNLPIFGEIEFKELDDFHPDRLCERLDVFHTLKATRKRLEDPTTFRAAAAQMHVPPPTTELLSTSGLLDRMIEETETSNGAPPPARSVDPFTNYLQSIVAPYLVQKPDPKQTELLAQVEVATAGELRRLLHYPAFQALEAAWRAVYFLVRNIETDVDLKIYLYNLPKDELAEDLLRASDLRTTTAFKILVEQTVRTPGAQPWSVIAANYSFEDSNRDVETLGRLALLANAAKAPLLAAAAGDANHWTKQSAAWKELRAIEEAPSIGLTLPRFLLRLPYGQKTDSIEAFEFEEMPEGSRHNDYLWGNPVFLCALLMGEAFRAEGWSMQPGDALDIHGLPLHSYVEDGEANLKSCTETPFTQTVAETLMEAGLMPLLWMKNSDQVRLAGFRAINGAPLAGPWT